MLSLRQNQRGDTLVEVLLSTVILSIVLAGAISLSNRATRTNQNAFEKTEVSNQMREQAELMQYLEASKATDWTEIVSYAGGVSPTDPPSDCTPRTVDPFYIDVNTKEPMPYVHDPDVNNVQDAYADIFRVWVEAYQPGPGYIDVHIRGCWEGAGGLGEQRTGIVQRFAQ